jgi:hypothetical protein
MGFKYYCDVIEKFITNNLWLIFFNIFYDL